MESNRIFQNLFVLFRKRTFELLSYPPQLIAEISSENYPKALNIDNLHFLFLKPKKREKGSGRKHKFRV